MEKMFYPLQSVICEECGATYEIGALELTRSAIFSNAYKHTCPNCRKQNISLKRNLPRGMIDCYNALKIPHQHIQVRRVV